MNIQPDAWPADTEHLRAEHDRRCRLETSLRAHLSRTINRAEKAEARIQAVRYVCAQALAVKVAGSTETDAAMAATAAVILRELDGTEDPKAVGDHP